MIMTFEDSYFDKEKYIYFFAYDVNGLFRINIQNRKMEFLMSVKEYGKDANRLFGSVVCINDRLFFSPMYADDVLIYDIKENKYQLIPIQNDDCETKNPKFYAIKQYNDDIIFLPSHYPAIIKLNIFSNKIVYFDRWHDYFSNYDFEDKDYFRQSFCLYNGKAIAPLCYNDDVLEIDLENGNYKVIKIYTRHGVTEGFSGICYDGTSFWLSSLRDNKVIKWDYHTNNVDTYIIGNNNEPNAYSYVGIECCADKIIVRPAYKNDMLVLNHLGEIIYRITSEQYGINKKEDFTGASTVRAIKTLDRDCFFVCPQKGDYYYTLSFDDGVRLEKCMIDLNDAISDWENESGLFSELVIQEKGFVGLSLLMNYIKDKQ